MPELGLEPRSISGPGLDPRMKRRRGGPFLFPNYSCTRVPGLSGKAHTVGALVSAVDRPPSGYSLGLGDKGGGGGAFPAGQRPNSPTPTPPSADTSRPHPRDTPGKFRREGASARAAPAPTLVQPQTMGARHLPQRSGEPRAELFPATPQFLPHQRTGLRGLRMWMTKAEDGGRGSWKRAELGRKEGARERGAG